MDGAALVDERLDECGTGSGIQKPKRMPPGVPNRCVAHEPAPAWEALDDIIVLSPQGKVLARLDRQRPLEHSTDAVIAEAPSRPGYVERFGLSDLAALPALQPERASLLYAHQVRSLKGQVVGVRVLRFRFADELVRIFDSVVQQRRALAVVLTDPQGQVVVSNDEAHVPFLAGAQRLPADAV